MELTPEQRDAAIINYAATLGISIERETSATLGTIPDRISHLDNYAQAMERQTMVNSD
jgi:hypothetical protein